MGLINRLLFGRPNRQNGDLTSPKALKRIEQTQAEIKERLDLHELRLAKIDAHEQRLQNVERKVGVTGDDIVQQWGEGAGDDSGTAE